MELDLASVYSTFSNLLKYVGLLNTPIPGTSFISALLLYLWDIQDVTGVVTSVSVTQSWNWFFLLTPFESVLLLLVMAKIGVLQILGILPINLSDFWNGDPSGRRRRRQVSSKPPPLVLQSKTSKIGAELFTLYQKLDRNECGLRALCELQTEVIRNSNYEKEHISRSTRLLLKILLTYSKVDGYENQRLSDKSRALGQKCKQKEDNANPEFHKGDGFAINSALTVLRPFSEAVRSGYEYGLQLKHNYFIYDKKENYTDSSPSVTANDPNDCQRKYPACPVTSQEVLDYLKQINLFLQEL